jgi:hypothetical protein
MAGANEDALRRAGFPVDGISEEMKEQLTKLTPAEVQALTAIKSKLNADLTETARRAADTVGGFVW